MDATSALKDGENALRDFIEEILQEHFGAEWVDKCGVTEEGIEKWTERQQVEAKKLTAGNVDPRLLYYAQFFDLKTILFKNWDLFKPCFGDKKTMEVYLDKMDDYRNPDAHRRKLLPSQEQLLCGISGEIRNAITNHRSKKGPDTEYFPRIEYVQDSFGNVWQESGTCKDRVLRPGDEITFVVCAWDPMDEPLEYQLQIALGRTIISWNRSNTITWRVQRTDIGKSQGLLVQIRSPRDYHGQTPDCDDILRIAYTVLP